MPAVISGSAGGCCCGRPRGRAGRRRRRPGSCRWRGRRGCRWRGQPVRRPRRRPAGR
ncbi:conserved hypothetical protein, partial [Ricinus communis]